MELLTGAELDAGEISKFVGKDRRASLFQTPEFLKVIDQTEGYRGYCAGVRESGELVGSVFFYDIVDSTPIPGLSITRRIAMGGPIANGRTAQVKAERIEKLLSYVANAGKKPLFVEVRNLFDVSGESNAFESIGFKFEGHLDFLIDLSRGEEELMKHMSSSGRRMVKKSLGGNLRACIAKNIREVDSFYNILRESYDRKGLPIADISLFRACFNTLGEDHCIFLLAKDTSDNIVAGRLELINNSTMFDWYAAAKTQELNKRPNELLVWSALLQGKRLGISRFDFGGAGKPEEEYGVREFKEKFGGERVNFGRYILIKKHLMVKMASKGYKLKKKIRSRKQ